MTEEEERAAEASRDPLNDDSLTLNKVTKLIHDQNDEVKLTFKKFCEAPSDSAEKCDMQQKLKEAKNKLNLLLAKEKQIKMAFAIKKQQS